MNTPNSEAGCLYALVDDSLNAIASELALRAAAQSSTLVALRYTQVTT